MSDRIAASGALAPSAKREATANMFQTKKPNHDTVNVIPSQNARLVTALGPSK